MAVCANVIARGDRVRVLYMLVEPDHPGLEDIAAVADNGALGIHVAKTFPLGRAATAHELSESGRVRGKPMGCSRSSC